MSALIPVFRGQPTLQAVHIDTALTNISIAFTQDQSQFIFPKIFPVIPVDHQSNKYWVWPKNDWLRDEARKRADSSESAGGGFTISQDSYFCDVWAFHKDLGSQVRANADGGLNLESAAVKFVSSRLMLRQEIQWATDFFTTGIWGTDLTGVAVPPGSATQFLQFNDVASDPFALFEDARERVVSVTGLEPNTLVMGRQVWRQLKNHPDYVDRIKGTQGTKFTIDAFRDFVEIDNIHVAKAIKATNNEGATAAYSFVHGKAIWLGYVAPNPGPMEPSAGYSFAWTGVSGGMGATIGVDSFEMRQLKAIRYEAEVAFDNKVVAPELGVFMASAVA
jgi:hypothetical protein